MLRLHGACLHPEGLSSLKRQDGLAHQRALRLRRASNIVQLDDLLEVPVCRDTILVGGGLDAIHDGSGCTL